MCGTNLSGPAPLPGWVRQGLDLRRVARQQRRLLWYVLAILVFQVLLYSSAAGPLPPWFNLFLLPVMLALNILIIVGVLQLLAALRRSVIVRILYAVVLFAPCFNLLMLAAANVQATRALRQAGLRVGFMGVKDDDLVRVLDQYRCHTCGYSLIGNTSGICPECGAPAGISTGPGPAAGG